MIKVSYISKRDMVVKHFQGSGNIVIYDFDQRLLKKFERDLEDIGKQIKINKFDSIIYFSKSYFDNLADIRKLLERNKLKYEIF